MKRGLVIGIAATIILVVVFVIYESGINNVEYQCKLDNDCPQNHKCFNSKVCSKGGDCEPQSGDLKCHKLCETNSNCPSEMPNCIEMNIFRGDVGELVKMCFFEECVEFGRKINGGQICCGVVTEEEYCVKRNALSNNTCAGAGEWYSTEERGLSEVINCCEGLVKLHPERVAGYCIYK